MKTRPTRKIPPTRERGQRRLSPVINQYHEIQITFKIIIPRPGPKIYSGTVKLIKKIAVLFNSIPKPLSQYHIKKKLRHNKICEKCFPGINANHLNHHIIQRLSEDKTDTVIIHVGVNDVINRTDHNNLILQIDRIGWIYMQELWSEKYHNFRFSIYKKKNFLCQVKST